MTYHLKVDIAAHIRWGCLRLMLIHRIGNTLVRYFVDVIKQCLGIPSEALDELGLV